MIIIKQRLEGFVRLNVVKNGYKRNLIPWFPNMVLDTGLDLVAASGSYLDCCHVGTSGLDVGADQISLLDPVQSTNNRTNGTNANSTVLMFGSSVITYRFPTGAFSGIVREIGFGPSLILGSNLFNRALIKDQFGNTSYTVVDSDESLEVEYEVRNYGPTDDQIGAVIIDGIEVGYTVRPAFYNETSYWCPYRAESYATSGQAVQAIFSSISDSHLVAFDSSIGTANSGPTGNGSNATYARVGGYVTGSYSRTVRAEWDIFNGNFDTGIKSIFWTMRPPSGSGGNSFGAYQIEFDDPILKTDEESFRIDLTIDWGRE